MIISSETANLNKVKIKDSSIFKDLIFNKRYFILYQLYFLFTQRSTTQTDQAYRYDVRDFLHQIFNWSSKVYLLGLWLSSGCWNLVTQKKKYHPIFGGKHWRNCYKSVNLIAFKKSLIFNKIFDIRIHFWLWHGKKYGKQK